MKISDCDMGSVLVHDNSIAYLLKVEKGDRFNYEPDFYTLIYEDGSYYFTDSVENPEVINLGPGELEIRISCPSYDSSAVPVFFSDEDIENIEKRFPSPYIVTI